MKTSELAATAGLTIPSVPVICDQCRQAGLLGEGPFSALPDILNFTPVQRRAHANGWREEHQRAFIAALAITGSPKQAARAIGRHQFGAEQLRTARGGKAFAEAWDAAMELARERETHRIHANLAELAERRDAELARISVHPERVEGPIHPDCDYDPELHTDGYPDQWQAKRNIRHRLLGARRLYLMLISTEPARRAAWELLVGPVDWARAERLEPQPDEPVPNPDAEFNRDGMPNMTRPDMVLTAAAGLLPDLTGGEDALAEIRAEVERVRPLPRDEETEAMLRAMAVAREAHPEDFE